jgi:hypothetical protein
VSHGRTISTRAKALLGGLSLLAVVCAFSQTPQPAQSRVVPLVSDSCPSVRIGDSVAGYRSPWLQSEIRPCGG